MILTLAMLDAIAKREGLRLNAYQDQGGIWTIGYGHTGLDVHAHMTITPDQALDYLASDARKAQSSVDEVKVPLSDNQYGALVSFAFNVGNGSFDSSSLLRMLNAGNYDSVPAQLMRWIYVKGKRNEGLINRRESEVKQWTG